MHTSTELPVVAAGDEVLHARKRRLVGLLHDLGLLTIVGRDWINPTAHGLCFGPLEGRAAAELVRRLDTLASSAPPHLAGPRTIGAGTGQLTLPFPQSTGRDVNGAVTL